MAKSLLGVIPADLTEEDFFPEQSLEELEKEEKEMQYRIEECEKHAQEAAALHEHLDAKREAMEKERESLSKSDAVGLKEKELELAAGIEEKSRLFKGKRRAAFR